MDLKHALALLDPNVDDHWTADGQPRIDVVRDILDGETVSRQEIIDAAPHLTRSTARDGAQDGSGALSAEGEAEGHGDGQGAAGASQGAAGDGQDADPSEELEHDKDTPAAGTDDGEGAGGAPEPIELPDGVTSVLELPPDRVLASPELTELAWRELEAQIAQAHREKVAIEERLAKLAAQAELLTRLRDRITRSNPAQQTQDAIRHYLQTSNRSREERITAAKRFIAQGTTARDVAAQLRGGPSQLDSAMGHKRGFGINRPAPRPPVPQKG
jgi:hypothetical protein